MNNIDSFFRLLTMGKLECLTVSGCIWMVPLTRYRVAIEHLSNALMVECYTQRASAGLIIAEASMMVERSQAFWQELEVHSQAQVTLASPFS